MNIPMPVVQFRRVSVPMPNIDWKEQGIDYLCMLPGFVLAAIATYRHSVWSTCLAFVAVSVTYAIGKIRGKESK